MRFRIASFAVPLAFAAMTGIAAITRAAEAEKTPETAVLAKKGSVEPAPACFCLRRKEDKVVDHQGCTRVFPANEKASEITCINDKGSEITVKNASAFDEIADGGNGCNPCPPVIRGKGTRNPRGNDDK